MQTDGQGELFGFEDMRPRLAVKKIISKERMEEGKRLMAAGDTRGVLELLRDVNEKLEGVEKRLRCNPNK